MAIDIQCIEASRYKYLWLIFENDREKFAEFLKVSAAQLPEPEVCRAIVMTGTVGPLAATTPSDVFRDFDKLLNVIATNNGWVAEIYLASPGGNVETGMVLGELARVFWLKTVAMDNGVFEYFPDFGALTIGTGASNETARHSSGSGWRAYSKATRGLSRVRLPTTQVRCTSTCASLFVGGVDRHGITYVHRVRRIAGKPPHKLGMLDVLQLSEGQVMAGGVAYLQHMDAGADVIRATQSTPANKVSPARVPRFPREVSELLASECDVNVVELEKQDSHIRAALTKAAAIVENCIITTHERKRLAQFAKHCSGRDCDRRAVLDDIDRRLSVGVYRPLAEEGHFWAQYNLGVMYHNGQGVAQDYAAAMSWFRKVADHGYAPAQYNLGFMYASGQGVSKDYAQAMGWFRKAADQGYAPAQYNLGFMYANGNGVPQNYAEAVKWYRRAADQGLAEAQNNLGLMYENGEGVTKNYTEAFKLYRLAADQRDALAQTNLGKLYHRGLGVPQDYAEAVKWFRLAADQGLAEAQNSLGLMYAYGQGVIQDDREAARLYKLAAEQGNAFAQANLGRFYDEGRGGLPKDEREATRVYRLAAEQGNATAQNNLGVNYRDGLGGVSKDDSEAARLFKLAAEQGNAFAQANLAFFYEQGRGGLPKDDREAARLYKLAAEQGNETAKSALKRP